MSFISTIGVLVPPLTAGGVVYGDGSQGKTTPAGTAGQYLVSNGAGIPGFTNLGSLSGENTAVGTNALFTNTTGDFNTAVGYNALIYNNSNGNTAVGSDALANSASGIGNTAVGSSALQYNQNSYNTGLGIGALSGNVTGSKNIAIGYNSGNAFDGSNNVVIGGYSGAAAPISGTGSGYIVLSDGAGTVRQTIDPSGNVSFSGGITPRVVVIADATSITVNSDTTDIATQANTQAVGTLTVNAPTGTLINGEKFILRLTSTNVQTFSWNAVFAGSTDIVLPAASSGGGKTDYVGFIYNSTDAKWQLIAKVFGF